MLKRRIIPVLLTDDMEQVVKPVSFERPYRRLGHLRQYIEVMESRNIDEILIIDIKATENGRKPKFKQFRNLVSNLMCPITYGGGISSLDDIRLALENGADKVAIKTTATIIKEASEKFGAQAIVKVIDYNTELIHIDTWAGEILLNDVVLDGTMEGYNIRLINRISNLISVPVIALGGCGEPEHMAQALDAGASAVAAGSMFLYTDHTPKSCAQYLAEKGYPVRV